MVGGGGGGGEGEVRVRGLMVANIAVIAEDMPVMKS